MTVGSPLSRYRLLWRFAAAVSVVTLLHYLLCLSGPYSGLQGILGRGAVHLRHSTCAHLHGLEDVFVMLKTGTNEARERLPVHFATTLHCVPHYAIYSDMQDEIAGQHVGDAFDDTNPEIVNHHPDFEYYRALRARGRDAFSAETTAGWQAAQNTEFGRDSPGWRLDKWKFLPLAEKALRARPDAKWFVFVETDTYVLWSNLLDWLARYSAEDPVYIGVQMQIEESVFAYGGSGYVLSRTALRKLVFRIQSRRRYYEAMTDERWAGDCVLGQVMEDAGVGLQWSWPNLYQNHPNDMDFDDHFAGPQSQLWCHHVASYHHMLPEDMVQFYDFETRWRQMNGRVLRHKDVFRQYLLPQLQPIREDWDNLSGDVTSESSSLEECQSVCAADKDCVQFSITGTTCRTSKTIRLGRRTATNIIETGAKSGSSSVTSGWMMDRVRKFMELMDTTCWDETWIMQ